MQWDELFDDLESQLERELDAEDAEVRAEEERLRLGRLGLRDRLVALQTAPVALELRDGSTRRLEVSAVGKDWLGARAGGTAGPASHAVAGDLIVPLDAVAALDLTQELVRRSLVSAADERALSARIGLPVVLRDLCRRRAPVSMVTLQGTRSGTIDRVGRDHLDLAEHDPADPRRDSLVRRIRVVPFAQLVLVRAFIG